jgi:hypothetical protein
MRALTPAPAPAVWNTPFGITDSDIKGPGIPKPIMMRMRGRTVIPIMKTLRPTPGVRLLISGVTRDKDGTALATCAVSLFRTSDNAIMEQTTSDGVGAFAFSAVGLGESYYVVAYKAGSPDVAGTTVNTLVGVA